MATLAAGSTVSVYCPLTGTMTVTPGTSGRVSINARGRDGSQSLAPRELYTAETLSVTAGDVVSLEAINVAATYTDPAEAGPALQALVSGAWNCDTTGASTAAANATGIQAALDAVALAGGGEVKLVGRGRAYCNPIRIPSGCKLSIEAGLTLFRADSVNAPLIRNKYGGQLNKATRFNRESNVVTVNNQHHGLTVGQSVWVGLLTDTTMNGIQTVASTPTAHTWTYASTGSDGAGGVATVFASVIPIRRSIAGASFSSTSNVVTVNDPSHDLRVGMTVWLGTTGASTAFVGLVEVIAVWPDNWQYVTSASGTATATGTIAVSYDYDITVTGGGTIDGNAANNGTQQDVDLMVSLMVFGCVNRSRVDVKRAGGTIFRVVIFFNAADCSIVGTEFFDSLVGVQWEASAKRTATLDVCGAMGKSVSGAQLFDDMVAFTGTKTVGGQTYDSTVSPYGLGTFLDNRVSRLSAPNALNGVKLTADATVTIDNLVIEDVSGGALSNNMTPTPNSGIRMVDDTAGLTGMVCGSIFIRRVKWFGGQYTVTWGSTGTAKLLDIDGVSYAPNAQQTIGNTGGPINIYGTATATGRINRLRIRNIHHVSAGASKPCIIFGNGNVKTTATIQIDDVEIEGFNLTPNVNASGACVVKYGNATILSALLKNGTFNGPASGTGMAVACNGPGNMGRWTFENVRTVAGGVALSFIAAVIQMDASDTVCAGEIVLRGCDISSASGIYDNATNWTGTLTLRMSDTRAVFTGNLLNLASATGLTVLHASPTVTTTADKIANTLAGTLRINGPSIQLVGSKVTAPQPGDVFWSTDTSTTGSASIGMKARTNAGAWAALF